MSLHIVYDHIFTNTDIAAPAKQATKKETVQSARVLLDIQKQVKGIEFHMMKREACAKRPHFSRAQVCSPEEHDEYVNNEISAFIKRKKWNSLAACHRWMLVQRYFDSMRPIVSLSDADLNEVRRALKNNTLEKVDYDVDKQTITRLNINVGGKDI